MSTQFGYLETALDFREKYFTLAGDLVGKVLPFTYKGIRYQIHFPKFDFSKYTAPPDHPKLTLVGTKIGMNWLEHAWDVNEEYGRGVSHDGTKVTIFATSRLIVRSAEPVSVAKARKAKKDLADWQGLFPAWLEALELRDLEASDLDIEQEIMVMAYYLPLKSSKARRIKRKLEGSANITVNLSSPITPTNFRRALLKTATNKRPPAIYEMLASSIKHRSQKKYRQSILDAATATEMAMTQLLDEKLKAVGRTAQQRKKLMQDYRQLKGLMLGLNTLGIVVSADIIPKVGTPRNKAIHEGREVTQTQADEALMTAQAFIKRHYPF